MKKWLRNRYLRMLVWWKRKITKELDYDTPQQEKAVKIVEKFIADTKSELLMAPLSHNYYIKNKNIFIVINDRSINIINGKYNYDIFIHEKIANHVKNLFIKKLETKRRIMEKQITDKVETILDVIYNDMK